MKKPGRVRLVFCQHIKDEDLLNKLYENCCYHQKSTEPVKEGMDLVFMEKIKK